MFAPAIIKYFKQIIVSWEKICCYFADEKLDWPSRTKKNRVICLLNQWKNGIPNDVWCCEHPWLWLADLHVKVLSDWVRYLVIVMCTGKSGIFRAQPVSLRGSNPDYSGRSASRVKSFWHMDAYKVLKLVLKIFTTFSNRTKCNSSLTSVLTTATSCVRCNRVFLPSEFWGPEHVSIF